MPSRLYTCSLEPGGSAENAVRRRAERKLLTDIRDGRRDAAEQLVRLHYAAVYRFMAYASGDAVLAEDLTQETFAAAWKSIEKFRGSSTIATWLQRIAYRKLVDGARRQNRAKAAHERILDRAAERPTVHGPASRASTLEDRERLYAAILELEQAKRVIVVLHYIEGLSFRETARVLDEPVGTVKWRAHKAVADLRSLLNGEV